MKVLFISRAMIVAARRDQLRALRRAVDVETIVPEQWSGREVEEGRTDLPVTRRPVRWDGNDRLHVYPGIRRVVREMRPDLVHIDEEPDHRATAQLARICRGRRIPSLFVTSQNMVRRLPPTFGGLRRGVYRRVAAAIASTETAASVLQATGFPKTVEVISQLGIDPERFQPDVTARAAMRSELAVQPGEFTVLFVGPLEARKGVFELVDAAAQLPDVRLVMVGEGATRERILEQASALGMGGRLRLVGRVPSAEMPRWYHLADVTVMPSRSTASWVEPAGRPLVESMACGVPVIGTDSGEIPQVVGDAGVIVPAGDARALASAIEHLHRTASQRHSLSQRGRSRATRSFTHALLAERTVDLYRQIIAESE